MKIQEENLFSFTFPQFLSYVLASTFLNAEGLLAPVEDFTIMISFHTMAACSYQNVNTSN